MNRSTPFRTSLVALVASIGCLFGAGCGGGGTTGSSTSASSVKDSFEKIKTGMSEKEVTDIMGAPVVKVELDPRNLKDKLPKGIPVPDLPAVDLPGMPLPKMAMKGWEEGDTAYEVVFQDGKVVGKNSGPKKAGTTPKVTRENADKIKIDMTKDEVEAILGKGTASAGEKLPNFSGEVVVWESDAGVITVGFIDDKVKIAATYRAKK